MADRPCLRALADRVGILPEYKGTDGVVRRISDDSRVLLLAAMGFNGATEESATIAARKLEDQERERVLPPVRVVAAQGADCRTISFAVPAELAMGAVDWTVRLVCEDGSEQLAEGQCGASALSRITVPLARAPRPGYHRSDVTLRSSRHERTDWQRLIVVPPRCRTTDDVLGRRRVFGLVANLYSVRSGRGWGIGDLTDVAALCRWIGDCGGEFVGLNPLHALRNRRGDISPYSPTTRLFRNAIYIDPRAAAEFAASSGRVRQIVESIELEMLRCAQHDGGGRCDGGGRYDGGALHRDCGALDQSLRGSSGEDHVHYAELATAKLRIMRALFVSFQEEHLSKNTERGGQYTVFCRERGDALTRYAAFVVLEDYFSERFGRRRDWHAWPAAYRRPDSSAVADFARAHAAEIEFQKYLQFEANRQLAIAAAAGREAGMRIGLYQDLAIGSAESGADTWANPGLFVAGARLGAPPDEYAQMGQDWGLPPIHPLRLTESRYEYWIQLLRANFAHSGALRIDHAMGLLRQYWIPPGAAAIDGAYVRYPAADLFGILALESVRHNALVIGEDLGTVPDGFGQLLEQWGVLSCQVMYFQHDGRGEFLPSNAYSHRALVTSTTHDHVPIAGFFSGDDLKLRRRVGVIPDDAKLKEELRHRQNVCLALTRRLNDEISPPLPEGCPKWPRLAAAVHQFLSKTPSPLLGVMLDDLGGETLPVNLPGVSPEQYPCWSRRMSMSIEDMQTHPDVATAMSGALDRADASRCHHF